MKTRLLLLQLPPRAAGAVGKRLCAASIEGKRPPLKNWQKDRHQGGRDRHWDKLYPYATNTGMLTQLAPTLDIDITNPEAAKA